MRAGLLRTDSRCLARCNRIVGEVKRESSTWRVDETFVRIAGRWMYLFRAVDSGGQNSGLLLVGNKRLRNHQSLPEEGHGQSGQSTAPGSRADPAPRCNAP